MLVNLLVLGACLVNSFANGQRQITYLANFSTTSYDCGAIGCPPKSYPYYDSLYYANIADEFESETGSGNCVEICAHSPEFYGVVQPGNPGAISANYENSTVKFFSFKSFWAGCEAPKFVQYPGNPPQNYTFPYPATCNITVKGYPNFNGMTGPPAGAIPTTQQTFTYTPSIGNNPQGLPYALMSQFTVSNPAFSAVRIVTFSATSPQSPPGGSGFQGQPTLYLDDLVYTVFI